MWNGDEQSGAAKPQVYLVKGRKLRVPGPGLSGVHRVLLALSSSKAPLPVPLVGQRPSVSTSVCKFPNAMSRGHRPRISVVLTQFNYPGPTHANGVCATGVLSGGPRSRQVHCTTTDITMVPLKAQCRPHASLPHKNHLTHDQGRIMTGLTSSETHKIQ